MPNVWHGDAASAAASTDKATPADAACAPPTAGADVERTAKKQKTNMAMLAIDLDMDDNRLPPDDASTNTRGQRAVVEHAK